MVNGGLKSAIRWRSNGTMSGSGGKRAHFCHESCVNQQMPTLAGALRSRFGTIDSWSIN
jgi:hypothetical protein